jgi:hypothetical protein
MQSEAHNQCEAFRRDKEQICQFRANLPTELQHGACTSEDVGVWTVVISIM